MSAADDLPDFLWRLAGQLRRRQIAIGVGDLIALRTALREGYGLSSTAALRDLLVTLWAKSAAEAEIVRAQFEQLDVGRWTVSEGTGAGTTDPSSVGTVADAVPPTGAGPDAAPDRPAGPIVTRPIGGALPAIPALGATAARYHLVPQYPLTERELVQAWRRLRRPVRTGPRIELDAAETVRRRVRTGVATAPVLRSRLTNEARLRLLVDRQGSMTPFHALVDMVVNAARQGALGDVDVLYFHDTPSDGADLAPLARVGSLVPVMDTVLADIRPHEAGLVYREPELLKPLPLSGALERWGEGASVVVISDAGAARGDYDPARLLESLAFTRAVRRRRCGIVWLNPVSGGRWAGSTAGQLARHVPMVTLDRAGLHRAVDVLRGHQIFLAAPL